MDKLLRDTCIYTWASTAAMSHMNKGWIFTTLIGTNQLIVVFCSIASVITIMVANAASNDDDDPWIKPEDLVNDLLNAPPVLKWYTQPLKKFSSATIICPGNPRSRKIPQHICLLRRSKNMRRSNDSPANSSSSLNSLSISTESLQLT